MNNMAQGLEVSLLGLSVTFLALGVFILIMVVLQRLFPGKSEETGIEAQEQDVETAEVAEMAADEGEGEVIAAIAVALNFLISQNQANLGASLEKGRSGWWVSRRSEARTGKVEKR
jgi:Na+-transporting methylmalonyl-CoA/oxaloacetate decarboxylase gamma subunit